MHLQQMHLCHYIVAAVFYLNMANSHADVIRKFDIASSPEEYTNGGGGGGSGHSGSSTSTSSSSSISSSSSSLNGGYVGGGGSGGSLSINSHSKLASSSSSLSSSSSSLSSLSLSSAPSSSSSLSSSLTSPSVSAPFTPSASSAALASLVQAEAPSLETFVSAASTSAFVEPYLDGYATTNVTAQIGTHAYLPCRVKQLGNKSVSWIRVRDGHILTVDRAVFIADQRFLALKQPDKFWTLQIKYVQARDAGAYECQVSTEPKVSARVHLQVVVPRTEILGDPDRYVKAGSTVILRCIVRGALEPPTFIMWYHGSEQLSAESRRHKTQVDRNLPEAEGDAHSTIGSLIIDSVKKRDTGNYTCSPSNSPSVTVTLNVINGESSASAVTSSAPVTTKTYSACSLVLIFSVIMIGGHRT
ncbi:hemicentin-2 [Stomoxys calcitrans]|uniref:hemicentin-2 n=1 Tax=Stomoxys calcitrans TaxID=35570 RepID=UPI0027E2D0AC|nr:hemicentin-2 [Stomoxys calcitrans]XP_059217532.1 hemicentin-2 [Stomoxys calcitrans]XP_059217533.1 hemicentin-2 [Stomoxys calcitrans]XP_059217534.1 hemicentin-2 [Stomoxys calcitrans]